MIYILVLITVSGIIAYIGDSLGSYVGKKRLTIFGLRPKITAPIVAIATGIIITMLTLLSATIVSEDVKIALFHLDRIKKETQNLMNEVLALKSERDELASDTERLKTIVKIKETGNLVFRKDEPLAARVIPANLEAKEVTKELTDLIISLIAKVRGCGVLVSDEITFFEQNRKHIRDMSKHIANTPQDLIIAAVAGENINAGEFLGNVRFLVSPNELIFEKDEEISSTLIDGTQNRGEIARDLKGFMDQLNQDVVNLGMLANPLTGRFGDLSSDSMISFYDMVNSISTLNREVLIVAFVPENTYAIGPLNVSFRFKEK